MSKSFTKILLHRSDMFLNFKYLRHAIDLHWICSFMGYVSLM